MHSNVTIIFVCTLIYVGSCRDFYVGMFKRNDLLVAQDRLYKEGVPYRQVYAKYGRMFNCKITYFRVVDRLGYGPGPKIQIVRGGLNYKYLVLRLTSPYNMPISVNIYVGCAHIFQTTKTTTSSTTNTANSTDSNAANSTDSNAANSTDSNAANSTDSNAANSTDSNAANNAASSTATDSTNAANDALSPQTADNINDTITTEAGVTTVADGANETPAETSTAAPE